MFHRSPTLKKLGEEAAHLISTYSKQRSKFSADEQKRIEKLFQELDQKAEEKDVSGASHLVDQLSKTIALRVPTKGVRRTFDWIIALAIALFIATIVRQLVFELYEIPSGSMRPTFREGDHLAVSKTTFGVNIPFTADHLFFSPERVLRGGVVTFTGEGVDLSDTDTRYFWLFPGKKRYIKRMIGKPEDTLTFYGGLIYGIDKNGQPIKELLEPPFLKLDHVPFNTFDQKPTVKGAVARGGEGEILYSYFNIPLGKLIVSPSGVRGEVFDGTRWTREKPSSDEPGIQNLMDWFGMNDFGQVRITPDNQLEISHHAYLAPFDRGAGMPPTLGHLPTHHSFLPLDDEMVEVLKKNLYTARFTVKNGFAYRLGALDGGIPIGSVPDGTYEFYHGEPTEIIFTGIPKAVSEDHPFRHLTNSQFKTLFNLGIEWHPYYDGTLQFPSRYAYYRDGALFVMGAPLLAKGDPRLEAFIKSEKAKNGIPFLDPGAPSKEKILATGLKIPKNHYLVLGDNYAMSSDGRSFGTIPSGNLEGSPSFIFWPPGDRMGATEGASYPWWNPYTALMWGLFALGVMAFIRYEKKKRAFPLSPRYLNT